MRPLILIFATSATFGCLVIPASAADPSAEARYQALFRDELHGVVPAESASETVSEVVPQAVPPQDIPVPTMRLSAPEPQKLYPTQDRSPSPRRVVAAVTDDPQIFETPDGVLESSAVVGSSEDLDFGLGRFESLPFRVNASIREGYDTNVLLSRNPVGSWFTEFGLDLFYEASDPRFSLEFGVFGDIILFYHRPGQNLDWNTGFNLRGSYKLTPRATLNFRSGLTYRLEPDVTLVGGNSRNVGGFVNTNNVFEIDYIWTERVSTGTNFRLGAFVYEEKAAADQQNRISYTIGQEFRYLVQPTITAVLDYRFLYNSYMTAPRDSTSHFVLAGANFQFAERLGGNFRGGMEFRNFAQSAGGGNQSSPFFETAIDYEYSTDSTVVWTLRYGLEESSVAGRRDRETLRTGISVNHAFTPRITGSVGFFYAHDDYDAVALQPSFQDNSFDATAAVRYSINRNLAVEMSYLYKEFLSGISIQNYARHRVSLGAVFSF